MKSKRVIKYRVAKIDDGLSRIEMEFTTSDNEVISIFIKTGPAEMFADDIRAHVKDKRYGITSNELS